MSRLSENPEIAYRLVREFSRVPESKEGREDLVRFVYGGLPLRCIDSLDNSERQLENVAKRLFSEAHKIWRNYLSSDRRKQLLRDSENPDVFGGFESAYKERNFLRTVINFDLSLRLNLEEMLGKVKAYFDVEKDETYNKNHLNAVNGKHIRYEELLEIFI